MAHETETKSNNGLTSDEQEKLIKLLNHPKLDEVLEKLNEK